tara:strand:- start:13352 stop:13867 length:516 start_codon:yes stop_codon:yes gene_type:complete
MFRFLSVVFFSLSLHLSSSEELFYCDHKKALNEDLLAKVIKHRSSAFDVCLKCIGEVCQMRGWQDSQTQENMICTRLFCTPKKVAKGLDLPAMAPRGKSKVDYSYSIDKQGKITDINILSTQGAFKAKDAKEFLRALTKRTRYEPLVNDSKEFSIKNLKMDIEVNLKLENE